MRTTRRKSAAVNSKAKGRASRVADMPIPERTKPAPDPSKKPWPKDCVQLVASRVGEVNVAGIRGRILDRFCADCCTRIGVDSMSLKELIQMPERSGRPLRLICVQCCVGYDVNSIDILIDRRSQGTSDE